MKGEMGGGGSGECVWHGGGGGGGGGAFRAAPVAAPTRRARSPPLSPSSLSRISPQECHLLQPLEQYVSLFSLISSHFRKTS